MKKIISSIVLLLCLALLCSCGSQTSTKSQPDGAASSEMSALNTTEEVTTEDGERSNPADGNQGLTAEADGNANGNVTDDTNVGTEAGNESGTAAESKTDGTNDEQETSEPDAVDTAAIEAISADDMEETVSATFDCNASFFQNGKTIVPLENEECKFQITYITVNGDGGYDWDFEFENQSKARATVVITAYKTNGTAASEVRSWSIDAESGEYTSDIISWGQKYKVFHIEIKPLIGEEECADFIINYT